MEDYRQVLWEPKLRLLLDYAVELTRAPNGRGEPAIAELRAAGWSDAAILEATEVIGFFNYYNRLVDALGVEPEPEGGPGGVDDYDAPQCLRSATVPPRQVMLMRARPSTAMLSPVM